MADSINPAKKRLANLITRKTGSAAAGRVAVRVAVKTSAKRKAEMARLKAERKARALKKSESLFKNIIATPKPRKPSAKPTTKRKRKLTTIEDRLEQERKTKRLRRRTGKDL